MLRRVLTMLAYLTAAVVVVFGTVALVAFGRGYSYDFGSGRFVLNGLIIFGSTPSGAKIEISGKDTKRKTPYRRTLESGDYDVRVTREGYRPWAKRLSVAASGVTFAQYIILLPHNLQTERLADHPSLTAAIPSPDKRLVAYVTAGTDAAVWVMNIESRQSIKVHPLAVATAEVPAETVSELAWSDDNTHLLFRSQLGPAGRYLLASANSQAAIINLTDLFRFDFNQIKFAPGNWRELYWISPEGLRKLNAEDKTASAVLADRVSAYIFGDNRVIYVQTTELGKSLWSLDRDGKKQELIQALPESDTYDIGYSKYRDRHHLAVIPAKAGTLTLYNDIFSPNPTSKLISKQATKLRFNPDGRYLGFYSTNVIGSYDLEKGQPHVRTSLPAPIVSAEWFDNHHFTLNLGGTIYLVEFDGENLEVITDLANGYAAFTGPESKSIIAPRVVTPGGPVQLYLTEIRR